MLSLQLLIRLACRGLPQDTSQPALSPGSGTHETRSTVRRHTFKKPQEIWSLM